ncbi:MAG: Crp/Fnr family transcriptional regulator [Hyphomicrobiaceae bacterium]
MTINQECDALQQLAVFRGVDAAKLKLLAFASQRVELEPGETLMHRGDPAEAVYVILGGEANVFHDADGKRVLLNRVPKGVIVGEMGVLTGRPVSATLEAATSLTALRIEKQVFLELMQDVPQIAVAVARELCRRLEKMSDEVARLEKAVRGKQ